MSITITNLIDKARNEFSGIIGLDLSSLVGMSKDNSHWKVIMEMVEKRSIPDQMDILGIYEVLFDEDGDMIKFKRKSLRKRGDTSDMGEEEL